MSPLYIEMMAVKSRHGGAISMTGVIARAIMHRDGEFYFFFSKYTRRDACKVLPRVA
jgi:hypothetical protein